jgi:hypothetical protein
MVTLRFRRALYALFFSLCLMCCSVVSADAQNLVPNGNFDQTNGNVPLGITEITDELVRCGTGWKRTTAGSSDYFHRRGSYPAYAPGTGFGYQEPMSDSAFAGILIVHDNTSSFPNPGTQSREYISRQLSSALIAGHTYRVTFWVARAEQPNYSTTSGTVTRIGAYMSTSAVVSSSSVPLSNLTPQVCSSSLLDSDDWQKITGTFTATGGEKYITIGNFEAQLVNTETRKRSPYTASPITPAYNFALTAYYFIDDVALVDMTPCVCTNAYSVTVTPTTNAQAYCCYNLQIKKNTATACDVWGVALTLPYGSYGYSGDEATSAILVTTTNVLNLGPICIPEFSGQQNITVKFLGENAYSGPDPFDPIVMCSQSVQIDGCLIPCCQNGYTVEYEALPGSSSAEECCYKAKIKKARANACDLYGVSFDLPGLPPGSVSTWTASPALETMEDELQYEFCLDGFNGVRPTVVHFLGADTEVMCTTTASITGCNGPACCDNGFIITTEVSTNASGAGCCYTIKIKKSRDTACDIYGAVLDIPAAYTGSNSVYGPSVMLHNTSDEITLGPICLIMPDETLDITLRLLDENSAVYEAVEDQSLYGCRKTITLTACKNQCCSTLNTYFIEAYQTEEQCCWNLYVTQQRGSGCEIYSAVLMDGTQYLTTLQNSNGRPLRFASPQDPIIGSTYLFCKNRNRLAGVSGVFLIAFLDADGDTLCVKEIPYSCGVVGGGGPGGNNGKMPSGNMSEAAQEAVALDVRPNPATDVATISFMLANEGYVQLDICNALGRVIASPVAGVRVAGSQSIQYNTGTLTAGMYYIKLTAEGKTITLPLTVVR